MDTAETRELQNSLRAMLGQAGGDAAAVASLLRELGWQDVVAEEPGAAALLFEEHGRTLTTSGLLDEAVLASVGADAEDVVVAYELAPKHPLWEPAARVSGSTVTVDGIVRIVGATPARVLVATDDQDLLLMPADTVRLRAVDGLDPFGRWFRVTAESAIDAQWRVPAAAPWGDAVAAGRRLLAAELVGLARKALELAIAHVTERHQFGRPIASFQAVRFRLAETKVAIEAASEAVRVSFCDGSKLAAVLAKTLAGSAAETAVRNAAQVCGAMGLTWEFGLHPLIRRSFVLDQLLGGAGALTEELGRFLADGAQQAFLDPLAIPVSP